jgi:4'-phosphopantetheinyl transferase
VVSKQAPAGCDVEWHRPRNVAAIAAAYFHPTEAAQLTACGPAQKLAAFYRLWTLKEAALKSQAHGLTAGLRTPAFTLATRLTCLQAHAAGAWTFAAATRRLGAIHYSLALAVAGAPTPWSVLWHTPAAAKYLASAQSMPWQTATSGTGRPG